MEMTINELYAANQLLQQISSKNVKFQFAVLKNIKAMNEEIELFLEATENIKPEGIADIVEKQQNGIELTEDERQQLGSWNETLFKEAHDKKVDFKPYNISLNDMPSELEPQFLSACMLFIKEE